MLATNHTLIGAAVGLGSPTVSTAFGSGVLSHLVCDSLPHWGEDTPVRALRVARIDGIVALAASGATIYAARRVDGPYSSLRVGAGIFGALLPDLDYVIFHFTGRTTFPKRVAAGLVAIQPEAPHRLPGEVLATAIAAAGFAATLAWVHRRRQRRDARAHMQPMW